MVKLVIFGVVLMAAVVYGALEAEKAVAKSSQEFAGAVYKQLQNEKGNLLICPVSVQTVMALVQQGAKDQTSNEIARILRLPQSKEDVKNGYKSLMNSFRKSDKVTMDIANRVFVKDGYKINPTFEQEASEYFEAGVDKVDFSKNVAAANQINQWVEQKTHDKIKNLISPDSITAYTRMILVNALYFKGTWLKKFEEYATREDNFYLNERDSVKVPMMSLTDQFQYASNADLDCQFLELPYDGNGYAMTFVLPNKRDGLRALENRIHEVLLPQEFRSERVQVRIPKFKIESTIKFTDILKKMGMVNAFSDGADFSGLLDSKESLSISEVIQKNFINVTEDGTEAASATAVGVTTLSLKPPPLNLVYFNADHPFIFILRKRLTQQQDYYNNQQHVQQPHSYNNQQNVQQPVSYNNQQTVRQPDYYNNQQNVQQPDYYNNQENVQQPDYFNNQQHIQQPIPPQREFYGNQRNEEYVPQYSSPVNTETNQDHFPPNENNNNKRPGFIISTINYLKERGQRIRDIVLNRKRRNIYDQINSVILFIGRYVEEDY